MSETADDTTDGTGTTEADYRWRWLSTIWALVYGFGYPAVLATVGLDVSEVVMLALVTAWGGTVVYIIGPENVKAWKELRGGGE